MRLGKREEDQSTALYSGSIIYIEVYYAVVDPFLRIIDNRMVAAHAYQKESPPGGSFLVVYTRSICLTILSKLLDESDQFLHRGNGMFSFQCNNRIYGFFSGTSDPKTAYWFWIMETSHILVKIKGNSITLCC